ncbi:VanZ family protein [Marinilabilia rubra]|uniref:VanZ family protein n=1 Tax=Marinilabilia rubra TaxID=2162893 RepID=A0A2U2B9L8_9BACT|nr:VanZ family protein [Marinilabilia rubra]PWD99744.1 VanZ family protein [Marinilabilia rubra]
MKKLTQLAINYKFTIITLATILFLSLKTSKDFNTPWFLDFPHSDKLVHFGMYGFLTLIYLIERTAYFRVKSETKKLKWVYTIWIVITGAIIEIVQPLIAGREKDIIDFGANTFGVIIAYIAFSLLKRYYNFNKIFSS